MSSEAGATTAKRCALTILHAFDEADAQFVGKAVALTDVTAGRWRPSGLTNSTACEALSKATLGSGLSQPSKSRKARCRCSANDGGLVRDWCRNGYGVALLGCGGFVRSLMGPLCRCYFVSGTSFDPTESFSGTISTGGSSNPFRLLKKISAIRPNRPPTE